MFFDQYPQFYDTSQTGPSRERLGARYRAIICGNERFLKGKRVLDIASHDGRWSFAALKAGSSHVTGIEARPHLVANAIRTFGYYGISPDRYRFIEGDAFEVLRSERLIADTILLLGFFYHINAHTDLVSLISATGASTIILDTVILPDDHAPGDLAMVRFFAEPTDIERNAVGTSPLAIVGYPSRNAIRLLFGHFGFNVMREIDWSPMLVGDIAPICEYANGMRSTFVLSREV